jgi:hypothetical protein
MNSTAISEPTIEPTTARTDMFMQKFAHYRDAAIDATKKISSETLGWIAVLIMHLATVPSLLAVMKGLTDIMLPIEMVLMIWAALVALFVKAAIQRDMLNLVTIGMGFVMQAVLMALIFFK